MKLLKYLKSSSKYFKSIKRRFSISGELIEFLWSQKLWWMIPFIVIFLIFVLLLVFIQTTSLAPSNYLIF